MNDVPRALAGLGSRVGSRPGLVHAGRRASFAFLLEIGERPFLVELDRGRVAAVEEGPFVMRSWSFALRASVAAWQKFACRYPEPGFHDIFAMNRFGHCRIEGDIDVLLAHLGHVKAVLSCLRDDAP